MIEGSFDISEVDVHLCRGCAIAAPESLASCRCRCRRTRTVCVGPRESVGGTGGVGTGKTHLAIALGMACCQHDYRVRFLTAAELTTRLVEAQQQGRLARKLDHLARFDVVILDELGYVPFDKAGADLLFGFISRRYERGSLVVTTNLPFARWSEVFLDATAAAAVIDRIVHHATVLTTNGDSYRLKAAQRNQTAHARQKKTR